MSKFTVEYQEAAIFLVVFDMLSKNPKPKSPQYVLLVLLVVLNEEKRGLEDRHFLGFSETAWAGDSRVIMLVAVWIGNFNGVKVKCVYKAGTADRPAASLNYFKCS